MHSPPKADYLDAHFRHWEDAEFLFLGEHWAGADQLFGYSAECGLKAVMKRLGMSVDQTGSPKKRKYLKHIKELWKLFFSDFGASWEAIWIMSNSSTGEPFQDWDHSDRYANRTHFNRDRVRSHRKAAHTVKFVVQKAKLEGII